jgi:hypothetical protein
MATFNYRTNPKPFAEQSTILQEAILVVAAKESKDIYAAESRARGCGCNNCHKDAERVKEWYL